jgi:hypothetical protein
MNDKEIKHNWISVLDSLPDEGIIVETKIQSSNMGDWCCIKRKVISSIWFVIDKQYEEFDQVKFTPTHWYSI